MCNIQKDLTHADIPVHEQLKIVHFELSPDLWVTLKMGKSGINHGGNLSSTFNPRNKSHVSFITL